MTVAHDPSSATTVVGVDGCPSGWVVANGREAFVIASLSLDLADIIGVDIPIGLADDGQRECDQQARRFLGSRASTVFSAPPRACLGAGSHREACERAEVATGRRISIQTYNLLPKIDEVDRLIDGATQQRLVEIHPECAFARMNGGRALPSKHAAEGVAARRALLAAEHIEVPPTPRGARLDDVLDACAVRWSALRHMAGTAEEFGGTQRDGRGLVMRIVS